jgi:anti-sigma regulatory factor (Ser/Thr protein kinase)
MNGSADQVPAEVWHAALPYRDPAELEVAACRFAEDAAQAGAALLVVCNSPALGRIRPQLASIGHVTWTDTGGPDANPGRMIHAISRFAAQHADRPAWCVQEAAWPSRPEADLWEVIRYEALMNLALTGHVRVLCPYYAGLPPAVISCAAAIHPLTAANGGWQPSPRYAVHRGQAVIPVGCEQPLPPPPDDARVVSYRDDLAGVRSLVSAAARAAGLRPSRVSDMVLAVGELTANTLAHTSDPGTLTLWATGDEMVCQVRDNGHITDPLAGQLRPGPAKESGGRGLWVVHQLCDLVQIRSGPAGTTIRVHMRLGS